MCDVTSQERTEELLLDLLHSCVVIITVSAQIMLVKEFRRRLIEREEKRRNRPCVWNESVVWF